MADTSRLGGVQERMLVVALRKPPVQKIRTTFKGAEVAGSFSEAKRVLTSLEDRGLMVFEGEGVFRLTGEGVKHAREVYEENDYIQL